MAKTPSKKEKQLEPPKLPNSDLSDSDMQKIELYKQEGLPGIAKVDEVMMAKLMDLYLSGKPYTEISNIVRLEKRIILYLSHKFNWYAMRMEYLHELENNIRNRVVESKIVSQDFLLQLTQMWQKRIGKKITKYLQTDNEIYATEIDLKEVDKYLKTIEMLHKFHADPAQTKAPAVGLNLGDGVTITKMSDDSVEITPKQKSIGDLLKKYSDSRKNSESSDILNKDSTDSDNGENNE